MIMGLFSSSVDPRLVVWDSRGSREIVGSRGQLADRIKHESSSSWISEPRRDRGGGSGNLVKGSDELVSIDVEVISPAERMNSSQPS